MSFLDFSAISNVAGSTSVRSSTSASSTDANQNSRTVFYFKGPRKAFSNAEPHLRNMINYSAEQQEYWNMAFGEPTVVKEKYSDSHYIRKKTWQTDKGPFTVEEFVNKKNGNVENKAYNIVLTDGSTARYDSNGDLMFVIQPDGTKLNYNHDDGSSTPEGSVEYPEIVEE